MSESLPFGLSHVDPDLAERLRTGLSDVETTLYSAVASDYPFVTEASSHLVAAGGKRFRPLLALVAAQYGDPAAPGVVPGAVIVELTHLATLYHDDVMDEAPLRRGAPSANARWDNTIAILTGDFLFARAADIAADLGPEIVRLLAKTFERLCTGQILETVGPSEGQDPVEHHLDVLAGKTGSLIAAAGRIGAITSGAGAEVADRVSAYGEKFGVAFQISDDLLDIASESEASGKTPGTDLREGVRTLPVLLALRGTDPEGARLRELLSGPLVDDDLHAEALGLLRSSPAMVEARAELVRWAEDARSELASLPGGAMTDALSQMCDVVVDRST
ncbi:MAG TPA: polyprenyl synthetase family protein [Candidatus Nanopelagicales bacterium]|nr:polyprenyl synthetase family protein [Candidatus Nanopelagicales bacterium]